LYTLTPTDLECNKKGDGKETIILRKHPEISLEKYRRIFRTDLGKDSDRAPI